MNDNIEFDTDMLLDRAHGGDAAACDQLLERHRRRLRRMVEVRMNAQLLARSDPSDVVQETMIVAHRTLGEYLETRKIPFYPWLRGIAWNRLIDLHRHHHSHKRSVDREVSLDLLNEESALQLVDRLGRSSASTSQRLIRAETQRRALEALQKMPDGRRQIIVMRHLEGLKIDEIAEILNLAPGTVMSRHFRTLKKLREMLDD